MKKILTMIMAAAVAMGVSAKGNQTPSKTYVEAGTLYVYGVCFSASDSVVYMTDLLMLKDAQLMRKNQFLVNRNKVSQQFADYMAEQGEKNRTATITFGPNLNKVDKKYQKQVEALKKRGFLVKNVDQTKFRFESVREEE